MKYSGRARDLLFAEPELVSDVNTGLSLQYAAGKLFSNTRMNIKNYSLDWIKPTTGTQTVPVTADPWVEAVNQYAPHILKALQDDGSATVDSLFTNAKSALNVPQLQLEQFVGVIDRMILNKQLTVIKPGESAGAAIVALPVPVSGAGTG